MAQLKRVVRRGLRTVSAIVSSAVALHGLTATAAFKCTDEKGRTHFSETPPAACSGTVFEINSAGNTVRRIELQAQPENKAEAAAKAAETLKASERRRRDTVLLDSYSSEREIDAARDRNVELLNARLRAAQILLQKLQARQKDVQGLVARNPQYVGDLDRVKAEVAAGEASVSRLERELTTMQAQFAADKLRWKELRTAN